ncbi:hypothetical protein B9T31_01500 [Acinetobacter sp. ANC 4558]|uniref:ciprofloxacin tolerance protein AciT n=1 Tax=Acinetobacter sp. ANC 4558 TaxID=1977876 RepID=UPI000A33DF96|nr:ciprofloxacin tolerance protein AciT [Acinetobacter sp. ANC 4558]OTG88223.1 hypothetical protein B9T31_01500 [Acinetobacter sp. ANC 4558]
MTTANLASILGLSLLAAALIAVFFSPYRRWLNFMLAGMIFWGLLESVRYSVQVVLEWPVTYSYLSAICFAMICMTLLLIREDRKAERTATAKRHYIEHTPVHEDESQQYSSR